MFFIFYIIVTNFFNILETCSLSVDNKKESIDGYEINPSFNDTEIVSDKESIMSKHKSLFHIIQNQNENTNLKSNIFDKMLSNEMLSIKQQLYERNDTSVSSIYITFKNSIATPKLELKQKWLIENPSSRSEANHHKNSVNEKSQFQSSNFQNDLSTFITNENQDIDGKKLNSSIKSKVLGVRSFSGLPVHHFENSDNHHHAKHQCTCMRTNPHTTCRYRCSETVEYKKKTCTQVVNSVTVYPDCTRNMMPLTFYTYYAYSPLFLGVTTEPTVIYYHPDAISEFTLSKNKYSKVKKPSVDNIYLEVDDNEQKFEDEYLENDYSSEEKKIKYTKNKRGKIKKVYFIDYKEKDSMSGTKLPKNLSDGYLQVLDKDKFVEDVVEDLKMYYSDAVIQECYCSISSFKFKTENLLICIPMFIIFIM